MSEIASKGQLRAGFLRWAVVTVPLILLLGFLSGRMVPVGSENRWYQLLTLPALRPPDWAFGVVWTLLYILIGVSLAIVLNARGARGRSSAIAIFAIQMVLNLAWTPLFFGAHKVDAALLLIVAIFGVALMTTLVFARVRAAAAWLMLPYLAWLLFAAALNWQIGVLNPGAEHLVPEARASQVIG